MDGKLIVFDDLVRCVIDDVATAEEFQDLEVYDLGTVFSVSAGETVSEVFVFNGSVQVNETGEGWSGATRSGAGVGICEAGEGVQAKFGETPMRFEADSEDVLKLFESVKGCAALKNPACAFQAVRLIADLWEARYMPDAPLAANARSKGDGTSPRHPPRVQVPTASARGSSTRASTKNAGAAAGAGCGCQTAGMSAVTNRLASDLYFSSANGGYAAWDTVGSWRVYQSSGGGFSGRLPGSNDTVRINAATLTAENGNALVIGGGVNAACGSFASGCKDYPGTACLRLEGGSVRLQNTSNTATNLFVRQDADAQALIRGWGSFTNTDESKTLRMIHNGQIIADGEGVERDLDFNLIAVVNNDVPNGDSDTTGWYAINKGRLLFPRVYPGANSAGTYSLLWGDLYTDTIPDIINSVGLNITFSTAAARYIRGGLCAPDRSDIPAGLPTHMRPIGVWFIGCFTGKIAMDKATFSNTALTFRYDHTQLKPTDSSLRLFRYDGNAWVRVGSAQPGGAPLISTDGTLAPVASGDYNIGWFALMAVERTGTLIAVQ